MPRHGLGAENPINDGAQVVFVLVFLIIWGIDSFLLHFAWNLVGLISLLVSVPIGVISFIIGVYFVRKSEAVVFSNTEGKAIDAGVYGKVRHPMYLGELLILLGFSISTLSILSFIVWIVFFIFLDGMATFEEKDLTRVLGQQYVDYQRRVRKWTLIRKASGK
ncbi:MAG TPA: methyltransferase [Candidatus Acidoferrum sp.]|nr:methyltransferase [Candidatus Acidoferrum sp.]